MICSARRLLASAFLTSVLVAAAATDAGATIQNTQGNRYRNLGGSDTGARAYLAGSGHTNSTGEIVTAVAIQAISGTGALFQIGEIQQSSDFTSNCGTGHKALFVEYEQLNNLNATCPQQYLTSIADFGDGHLFAVAYGSGTWGAYLDGSLYYTPPDLGYSSGYTVARSEAHVDPSNSGPSFAITWGPTGFTPWQFRTTGSYNTVMTSQVLENDDVDGNDGDNDWHLAGSPSPFNLNWSGF